jgi:2-polyprenyl-3-methyl-5-hydroxy-6-metoxy-1,4-benzoquinol methylase
MNGILPISNTEKRNLRIASSRKKSLKCVCCGEETLHDKVETAEVCCNVRAFRNEKFAVWRCSSCRSIHSTTPPDLNRYYRDYPFADRRLGWVERKIYGRMLRQLKKFGLRRGAAVLDYGCGSGLFIDYLREKGFCEAYGYDPFSKKYADPAPLRKKYDCVVLLDVLEHVEAPLDFLRHLRDLLKPGGLLFICMPDSAAIDLSSADKFKHSLHQPYHRHLISATALLRNARELWLKPLRVVCRHSTDTFWPFVNWRFFREWLRTGDDTINVAFEGPVGKRLWRKFPRLLLAGLFGAFFPLRGDLVIFLQRPA